MKVTSSQPREVYVGHMRLGSAENSSTTNSDNELYSRISHPLAAGIGVTTPLP